MQMFVMIALCVTAASEDIDWFTPHCVGIAKCDDEKKECACPFIYWPVCGKDGNDYDNDCLMECAGTELASEGKCEQAAATSKRSAPGCACPRHLEYVCGTDGKTYDNPCLMECAGTALASEGKCDQAAATSKRSAPGCACPRHLEYVCGTDGKTYDNPCLMECAGVPLATVGECVRRKRDACNCPEQLEMPVCGKDGITYNSMCELGCAGTQFRFLGRCPATPAPATDAPAEEDGGDAVVCTADYTPVCGDDGVTYGNLCQLENTEGVTFASDGECGGDSDSRRRRSADVAGAKCSCPDQIDFPVCGKDGVTYNSMCAVGCSGVGFRFMGHCPPTQAPETTTAAAESTTAGAEETSDMPPCEGDDCDDDE